MQSVVPARRPVKAPPNPEITFFLSLSPAARTAACRGQNPSSPVARAYKAALSLGLSHDVVEARFVEMAR
jgi:hypothetical protein